jgi:hypothetical protein
MLTKIRNKKFDEFLKSQDTLRVYKDNKLIFASREERLAPLLEYAMHYIPYEKSTTVFDRVVGNAAAMLLKKILCSEVFSQLGSENAIRALDSFGIKYHFNEVVPYIEDDNRQDMCPMEKMSSGKTSEEFYQMLRNHRQGSNEHERKSEKVN